jgi:hypothetical protein
MKIAKDAISSTFSASTAILLSVLLLPACTQQGSSTTAASGSSTLPAAARGVPGRYDGTWQVMSTGISLDPSAETSSGCGSIEIKFQVADSQIAGGLKRTPYGNSVESGQGFLSAPMSGTVQPDGTVAIFWERYVVTGTMSSDKVKLQWKGECGPRDASGDRVAT